jgi:hypothetical protein
MEGVGASPNSKGLIPERSVNRAGLILVGELTSSGRGPASHRPLNLAVGPHQLMERSSGWLVIGVLVSPSDQRRLGVNDLFSSMEPGLTFRPGLDVSYLVYTQGACLIRLKELSIVAQRGGFG